jgi:predicted ArsR family transcriptional regulator
METLAKILNRSVRTVQRHLHQLREAGVIEFVERRRYKGRFSSYLYRILFHATTGHGKAVAGVVPNIRRTRHSRTTPKSPVDKEQKRAEEAKRRTAGYEWLFGD